MTTTATNATNGSGGVGGGTGAGGFTLLRNASTEFLNDTPSATGAAGGAGGVVIGPNGEAIPADVKDASVVDHETRVENKRFTVYKMAIKSGNKTWSIYRRYNEFYALNEKLKKIFPSENLKLPGKRLLGNNFDPNFIQYRRTALHEYLQKLIAHPEISQCEVLKEFLTDNSIPRSKLIDSTEPLDSDTSKNSGTEADNHVDLAGTENQKASVNDFYLLKVIGKGSFGKVLLAKHKETSKVYAIKVLSKKAIKQRNEVKHIMAERNVLLKNIQHPFLVGLHYSFQTPEKLYFVLDYVNGGELFFHLQREKRFPEVRARFYAAEIVSAIEYLHKLDIVYRDLKPENILLDSKGHVILTDFGLCKEGIQPGGTTSTFCGTPEYLAPEVLRKQQYGRPVDWWCLGAVLYEMLVGLPPFYSRDCNEMYNRILHDKLRFPPHVSDTARSLISGLLERDPEKRLGSGPTGAEEIKKHAFFSGIDWDELFRKEYKAPFNPGVNGNMDLKNFDPEFVNEPIPGSLLINSDLSVDVEVDDTFAGFTYTAEDPFLNQDN